MTLPPIAERLRSLAATVGCDAWPGCQCEPCRVAVSLEVVGMGVAVHSRPFARLCWLLDNILAHPEHPDAEFTPDLLRAIVPVLTRDEWVDALAWNPHPWGGGEKLRSNLMLCIDLMAE
jgi:hypothetical protein